MLFEVDNARSAGRRLACRPSRTATMEASLAGPPRPPLAAVPRRVPAAAPARFAFQASDARAVGKPTRPEPYRNRPSLPTRRCPA